METIPAKITSKLVAEMDSLVKEGWFANRSEFIRDAVREKIKKSKLELLEQALQEDVAWGLHGKG